MLCRCSVLIESDWNLKEEADEEIEKREKVLIESDWNLKVEEPVRPRWHKDSINRIRLEFKV